MDLFLVWVVVYRILLLTKRSGAIQIVTGLAILALACLVSIWLDLTTFNWLLENFFSNLLLIVVILFQVEIRHVLAQIGSNPFWSAPAKVREKHVLEEITQGAIQLAQKGYGGLIVIEREIALDYFIETGTVVDSRVSAEIFSSLFHSSSPLHDGAVVVREGRIHTAGCFLPLSKNPVLDKNLGARHRAALGLTEETDAVVLVISEETKSVGLVHGGTIIPDVDQMAIRKRLYEEFGIKFRTDRAKA